MSQVYVVQMQHRWDAQRAALVPKFDLSKAEEHGDLVYLLSPSAAPFNSDPLVDELRQGLASFNPERDSLLLIGNPVLIGLAVAVAACRCQGRDLTLLQWSGREDRYVKIRVRDPLTPRGN